MFVNSALTVTLRAAYSKRQTYLGTRETPQAQPWPTACWVVLAPHYSQLQAMSIPAHTYRCTQNWACS